MKLQTIAPTSLAIFVIVMASTHATADSLSDPAMAINQSDQYAWTLFSALNAPSIPGARDAVWETWIEQEDVYRDPANAPVWNTKTQLAKNFNVHIHNMILTGGLDRLPNDFFHGGPAPFVSDAIQEVRLNKPAFDYIVDSDLWYQEGLLKAATLGGIRFPLESRIVKTTWVPIEESQKSRYHWQMNGSQLVGMVAWGIMTKDLPTWFWATFEHVDNVGRSDITGSYDSFGAVMPYQPPNTLVNQGYPPRTMTPVVLAMFEQSKLAEVWQYYRLKGTQVSFTDEMGRPIIMGNSLQEAGQVSTSSCMTCHARASVNQGVKLAIPVERGRPANQFPNPFKSTKPAVGFVGTPDSGWFFQEHSMGPDGAYQILYPVDFLWELPLLTKPRTASATYDK